MASYSLFGNESGLPHTTKSNIPYEVDSLDFREQWMADANQTVIIARVKGFQAYDFVTDMVGRSYFWSTTRLGRDLPEVNPFDSKQYCSSCIQVDQGGNPDNTTDGPTYEIVSGWPLPRWVRYRCTFAAAPYQIRSDTQVNVTSVPELFRYCIRKRQSQAREMQFPGGSFRVVDADPALRVPLMQVGFKVISFADVTYQFVRWPVECLPLTIWESNLGKINNAVFDPKSESGLLSGGYAWPAETLLFAGYDDTHKYFDANEDWVCDPILRMRFNQIGYNKYLNNLGVGVSVSSDGTGSGTKPYTSADFNALCKPAL